jgi:hypothetical protein
MTDGDVSHSSEMRLDTSTKCVGLDLFSLGFAFLLCSLVLYLLSFRCLFPHQWGLSPEWVKPTVERGGLFLLVFVCYISLFSRC